MADAHPPPSTDQDVDRRHPRLLRVVLLLFAWSLAGLDLSRLTGLWPCDIACQGGAYYQTIMGVSVLWPAFLMHSLLSWLTLHDLRSGRTSLWTTRLVLVLLGVAGFYWLIARDLGMHCDYCSAVRTLTQLCFLLIFPVLPRVREVIVLPLAAWLVMNALYHHATVADVAVPAGSHPALPHPAPDGVASVIDQGRTYGDAAAPRTLEVVIDLTCGHCAEQYRPLMEALKPALAARRVLVVVRHLVRPSQHASRPAAELAFAAAAMGQHAVAMEVLLGSNPEAGASGLQARVSEVVAHPERLAAIMDTDHAALAAALSADQLRIGELGVGPRTPAAALSEDGRVTMRWSGELPVAAITAALDGGL